MEKIIYDNEEFYFNDGRVYDSSFCEAPRIIAQKVLKFYYSTKNYETLSEKALLEHVKNLKISELYNECLKVIDFGLDKFYNSVDFYKIVFPIITSCYRALGQPQKAIDFWMANKSIFTSCISVPLLTSLAAAYCDVQNYKMAKKCADRAYALQGGGLNQKTELSLVYMRIKREMK